ncbi:MAG: undecaprenyl-phosphate glucose phosphotransferase [Paludibacteraceae bacterium]|nr:undecaprenyl-phosphate glucose phosphotransferase [Paludibacteraceae bacterium]
MRTKKQQQHTSLIKVLVAVGDFLWINFGFILMTYLYRKQYGGFDFEGFKSATVIVNLAYAISIFMCGIILDKRVVFSEKILALVTKTVSLFAVIVLASFSILGSYVFSVGYWFAFLGLSFITIAIWRISFRYFLKSYRRHGGNTRNIIILGAGRVANKVYNSNITNEVYGYKFMGFFDDRDPADYRVDPQLVKGTLADVEEFVKENQVDEIICALPAGDDRKALPIMKYAENNLIRFMIVPDFMRFISRSVSLSFLDNSIPIVSLREEPLRKGYNQLLKRTFDIIVSLGFCLTIFPIMFIILAPIIKYTSKGPIFFKQKRTGENGSEFYCLKFRTMEVNDNADNLQATKGDSRVTKIGAIMRKTNLDEMPQFLNVLIGDMSIVGPRPHMLKHTEMYSQLIDKYMVRHFAKPGITGWAQVTGYRGETKELADMEGRVKQDVWYIENWTFWLDIKIIFKTVKNMIKGEDNAY